MEHDLGMIAFGHPILNDLLLPYATVAPLKCYYIITQVLTDMGIRLFGIGLIFGGSLSIAVSKDQLNANLPKEIAGRLVYWRSNIPDRSQTFGVKLRTPADLWLH